MGQLNFTQEGSKPDNPASSRHKLYPKSDGWYRLDSTGTEYKLADLSDFDSVKFGSELDETEQTDVSASTSYSDVITFSLTGLDVGAKYRVAFHCNVSQSNASADSYLKTVIDGNDKREAIIDHTSSNDDIGYSFVHYVTATSSSIIVKLQHKSSATWATSTLVAQGEIWRVI